jgi:DNA invertase Pin-like site-specific DNA recombinase
MRAAIYTRISDDRDGRGIGVDRQREDCEQLVKRRRWQLVEHFSDNDISASKGLRRPGYDALQDAIEDGRVDVVVAYETTRLWRNLIEQKFAVKDWRDAGLKSLAIVTNRDVDLNNDDGDDEFLLDFAGLLAERESRVIKRRVRRAARRIAEEGRVGGGGTRPFGFNRDRVTINEDEAVHIKEAVRRLRGGDSYFSIMTDWNNRGITTSAGKPWTSASLKRMLCSPRIAGLRQHQGAVIGKAIWPAIITPEDHELLANRPRKRYRAPHRYLLTTFAYSSDGKKLTARPRDDGSRSYRCQGTNIAAQALEDEVVDQLLMRLDKRRLARLFAADEKATKDVQSRAVVRELREIEEKLDRLNDLYIEGRMSKSENDRRHDDLIKQRDILRKRLDTRSSSQLPVSLPRVASKLQAWWADATFDDQRKLLAAVVERIIVSPPAVYGRNTFDTNRVKVRWRI